MFTVMTLRARKKITGPFSLQTVSNDGTSLVNLRVILCTNLNPNSGTRFSLLGCRKRAICQRAPEKVGGWSVFLYGCYGCKLNLGRICACEYALKSNSSNAGMEWTIAAPRRTV